MKAPTQYNDLTGTAAADISDYSTRSNTLSELASYFKIDPTLYRVVGVEIYGIKDFSVRFICVDLEISNSDSEHLVSIGVESNSGKLEMVFKRFHIVLYEKFDEDYRKRPVEREIQLSDIRQ